MICFIGLVGLAEPFTGLSGEPPYLVERFELNSFSSSSSLQTKNIAATQGSLKPESPFSAPVTRNYINPKSDCEAMRMPRKGQRLRKKSRVIRNRPCLACLIESPPNKFIRHLSIFLRIRVGYSTGVVPTLS